MTADFQQRGLHGPKDESPKPMTVENVTVIEAEPGSDKRHDPGTMLEVGGV